MKRTLLALTLALAACGPPKGIPAEELVRNMPEYLGKRVVVRTKLKSGARCRIGERDGEWKTYCKDCQYCRGPLVIDVGTHTSTGADAKLNAEGEVLDWPLVLAGSWEYKEIRCKGPLNAVECWPLQPGKMYLIQGKIEAYKPPRLIFEKFWPVD